MIRLNRHKSIAFISSFPPRHCGIATFASFLIEHIGVAADETFEPAVVAMQSDASQHFSEPVECVVRRDVRSDYMEAADYINAGDIDAVSLQHEFGLFGGPGGSYIVGLLRKLNVPVVSTLHTVLEDPSPEYFQTTLDVCDSSDRIVVMNLRGVEMLTSLYGIPAGKIELIPHGIPDVPFGETDRHKSMLGLSGRKVLMTFGLIGPNKGIEVMLKAMPEIVAKNPDVLYLVVGAVHPEIVKEHGYSYRDKLRNLVVALGLEDNVLFHDRFVSQQELNNLLGAADVYVTPYLNKEQVTSGTLAFAVGCGKAVVSTPYWAAEELLADGRGVLVPFGDPPRMAEAINRLLGDERALHRMARSAYDYGRAMTWPKVGRAYWDIFKASRPFLHTSIRPRRSEEEPAETITGSLETCENIS